MKELQKPKDKLGYTTKEILEICKKEKIQPKRFWYVFGVNTVAVGKDNKPRFYVCDVERALWVLGSKRGKYHEWD